MTDRAADRWVERRRRMLETTGADALYIRQVANYAARFADVAGHQLTAADVLAALNDTGLCLIRDTEGTSGDAHRWAVFLVDAEHDPLDQDPAVDSHWDREAEGRDEAARRPNIRHLEEGNT